ncbi:MAG: CDP-glycerol glycerophosphotransferase family protein [Flavobacteriales bacterium]|nr:CDP-glycerol glycerophosphotransferase family protein [Flavobacteriales bacterium]
MRIILFCQNPYALAINKPINDVAVERNYDVLWYIPENVEKHLSFDVRHTDSMKELFDFNPEAIIAPGNEVPHYLPGVKTQIFHGLAGEKKGHFHIRNYFDLYLTQGPYFTRGFDKLRRKHKNFDVVETGWPKLDTLYVANHDKRRANEMLAEYNVNRIILYAPTFSPSLTSAKKSIDDIFAIADDKKSLLVIKFHDLMDQGVKNQYIEKSKTYDNVIVSEEKSIIPALVYSDLMISDTSSAVYEFLILDKPVITINTRTEAPRWLDLKSSENLNHHIIETFKLDSYNKQRQEIIAEYHPYSDGKSSERVLDEIQNWITKNGVPSKRKLSFLRRRKINKLFGKL